MCVQKCRLDPRAGQKRKLTLLFEVTANVIPHALVRRSSERIVGLAKTDSSGPGVPLQEFAKTHSKNSHFLPKNLFNCMLGLLRFRDA